MTSQAVSLSGAVDADGHILEPPDLWETYLEEKYRDRAIRVRTDEEGYEILEFDGKPSKLCFPGFPGILGGMGEPDILPSPERTYLAASPPGSMNPRERVERLDGEGLSKAVLYPTIGLLWEAEVSDPEIADAYCRAYNRWIVDFCSEAPGRLYPIAHLSMADVDLAVKELERAVRAGCKGGFFPPYTWTGKSHGHPYYHPLWEKAQELDVPLALHPAFEPLQFSPHQRFDELKLTAPIDFSFFLDVCVVHSMQQAFVSLFNYGVFEKFPRAKAVVLESQAGWIGYLLDRMDAVWAGPLKATTELRDKPSEYFRRQCWISADPDERALAHIIEYVGADRFFWASDFPHPDHTADYMQRLRGLLEPLPPESRAKIAGENVTKVYQLD